MLLMATVLTSMAIPAGTVLQLEVADELLRGEGERSTSNVQRPTSNEEAEPARIDMGGMVARYDVAERTIRRWVREKRVPFFKIGGKLFFHTADLDAAEREIKIHAARPTPVAMAMRRAA
jgi:hypothetical protein